MEELIKQFVKAVVSWYSSHGAKDLPWRNVRDPWLVLLAAVLLRKTTSGQVASVFSKIASLIPTPRHAAEADPEELKRLIRPLGIVSRADCIVEIGRELCAKHNCSVPCELEALDSLPCVGRYAASEVLLATCGKPAALLDTNMARVLQRVLGVQSAKKRPHTDRGLWALAESIVPKDAEQAKAFNYGVLDIARMYCGPKSPKCNECPLKRLCLYANKET